MKKLLKNVLCCLMTLLLAFSISVPAFAASSAEEHAVELARSQRVMDVFNLRIAQIEGETDLSIACIKSAYDFAGNEYTIVECEPEGYLIYHNASGVFVESSPTAPSPYAGLTEGLFFNGPAQYYTIVGDELVHTITNDKYSVDICVELEEISSELNCALMDISDATVLNYVEDGLQTAADALDSRAAVTASTTTHVPFYTVLYRLKTEDQIGYLSGGNCGYIGLGLLLLYADYAWNSEIIDNSTYLDSTHAFKGTDFTQYLIEIGQKLGYATTSTVAFSIANICSHYLQLQHVSITPHLNTLPPASSTITGYIDQGLPVELFGNMPKYPYTDDTSRTNHAIVIYGYSGSGSTLEYHAHYGWANRNDVWVASADILYGSSFAIG